MIMNHYGLNNNLSFDIQNNGPTMYSAYLFVIVVTIAFFVALGICVAITQFEDLPPESNTPRKKRIRWTWATIILILIGATVYAIMIQMPPRDMISLSDNIQLTKIGKRSNHFWKNLNPVYMPEKTANLVDAQQTNNTQAKAIKLGTVKYDTHTKNNEWASQTADGKTFNRLTAAWHKNIKKIYPNESINDSLLDYVDSYHFWVKNCHIVQLSGRINMPNGSKKTINITTQKSIIKPSNHNQTENIYLK